MALINCPECNKEISDKAISCPHCGVPMNIDKSETVSSDSYLCCPKCKSKDLHTEKKGFSGKKALAGVALTGGIGLLAGTIGSNDVQIYCLKCGNKFKAGEAGTTSATKKKSELENLEKDIIMLLCEDKMLEAKQLYKATTHSTDDEWSAYFDDLLKRVDLSAHQTEEQKERNLKRQEELLNKKSGCMLIAILLLSIPSLIAFLM